MIQHECEKCEGRGDYHSPRCIVRRVIFDQNISLTDRNALLPDEATDVAVFEVDLHTNKQREINMSALVENQTTEISLALKLGITESQLDLVKRTVAKNATPDELELFFYRCKELQLNPLMPGQVYFLKFGNSPGTVIVGLDGFRARAQRTGKLSGIKRGVIRNDKGECIGGWADVYRKDWDHPAHEEVPLSEYFDPRKPTWKTLPETMIKKVAEVAALRMAFPEELGGVYTNEEMDKADSESSTILQAETHQKTNLKPSQAQLTRLFAIAKSNGVSSREELKSTLLKEYGHQSFTDLSLDEYEGFCKRLESMEKQPSSIGEESLSSEKEVVEDVEIKEELPWEKYLK